MPGRAFVRMLLAAWLATAVASARLQNPQQPTFRTEANYVRVDVYATTNGIAVSDLGRDDLELLEDNVPQTITAFEHVVVRGGMPQETRREPNTVAESRAMLENSRARVFAIFLDTNHVSVEGSYYIRQPLINALNRLIGPDDLVGVMTPGMTAADVTFARRTTTIEGMLTRHWTWGERDQVDRTRDPQEEAYQRCYPGTEGPCGDDRGIADQMIARRREKLTIDSLGDLIDYLETAREERKALLVISEGWLLYRPDASLSRLVNKCQPPAPPIGIDPRTGRLTTGQTTPDLQANETQCERDRMMLAQLDDDTEFRTMLDRANRANVSFYPVDPRGLVVFDSPIATPRTGLPARGQTTLTPPSVDSANLRARQNTLRDLAAATDGLAIIDNNNLEAGLRRVTDDLSSYYLLGYYSTGKLDGKFHSIRVRARRPGVQIRARRGYLAASAAEAARAQAVPTSSAAASPGAAAGVSSGAASAVATALTTLGSTTRDVRFRVSLASGRKTGDLPAVWAAGEFTGEEWRAGAEVDLTLVAPDGQTVATAHQRVAPGSRSFLTALTPSSRVDAGEYTVRVRGVALNPSVDPVTEIQRIAVDGTGASIGAVLTRRGPSTANRDVPTADARFRRNEQLRIEIPDPSGQITSARLLDRIGNPMAVPVAVTARTDADSTRWASASLNLAPLGAGDYVIELGSGAGGANQPAANRLVAFRIVP